jgi:hypothetical protein
MSMTVDLVLYPSVPQLRQNTKKSGGVSLSNTTAFVVETEPIPQRQARQVTEP